MPIALNTLVQAALLIILLFYPIVRSTAQVCPEEQLQFTEIKTAHTIRIVVQMPRFQCDTITITGTLSNLKASPALPLTVDSQGRSKITLTTLTQIDPTVPYSFYWHYAFQQGGRSHKDSSAFLYALPYLGGPCHVGQGYFGTYSHARGSRDEYALDFDMPVNTAVCAARGGTVVGIKQDAQMGGPDPSYGNCTNYIIIDHGDGTYAEYKHLNTHGALVHLGQHVTMGQVIAASGNTGWSTTPHLHFAVFHTIDGTRRKTIPVKFRDRNKHIVTIQEGGAY